MKKCFLILVILFLVFIHMNAQNIGIGTESPDSSAQLEVKSAFKGFLPPRVILTAANNPLPINKPAQGLLIYNLVSAGATPDNVYPGYYYWSGNRWVPLENRGSNYGDMQYWNGTSWVNIPLGLNGQVLTISQGIPLWGECPCQSNNSQVLTAQPVNNPYEGILTSNNPNTWGNGTDQLLFEAWTVFGAPLTVREIVKFDFSFIANGSIIDSAKLYLYADSVPINGNKIDPQYGTSNASYVQRITSAWTTSNQFTWGNQPLTTSLNQVEIPQSSSSFEDNILDVTLLVRDMQNLGNNGFLMRLQNETAFNSRQYESSFSNSTSRRPKLIIYYH